MLMRKFAAAAAALMVISLLTGCAASGTVIWSTVVTAEHTWLYLDEAEEEILLMADEQFQSIDLRSGSEKLGLTNPATPVYPPYRVEEAGGRMVTYPVYVDRQIAVIQMCPASGQSRGHKDVSQAMRGAFADGEPFSPIMFIEQHLYITCDDDVHLKLEVKVETDDALDHRVQLTMRRLNDDSGKRGWEVPGFVKIRGDEGFSLWACRRASQGDIDDWKGEFVDALKEARILLGVTQPGAVNVIFGPSGPVLYGPRNRFDGWYNGFYQQAAILSDSAVSGLIRHEAFHVVHTEAMLKRSLGRIYRDLPLWVVEGTANYFGDGASHSVTRAQNAHDQRPVCTETAREALTTNPYVMGAATVAYLFETFEADLVVQFLLTPLPEDTWEAQQAVTTQFFGMTPEELLVSVFSHPWD